MKKLQKKKSFAFGKDVYLLGIDEDGVKYWLEAPAFDCGWYWAFGYVETYTNNNKPEMSKDIISHQHIRGFVGEKMGKDGGFCHNLFDSVMFKETTFSEAEGWELSELFEAFYLIKNYAELKHRGSTGLATSKAVEGLKDKAFNKYLNENEIPAITKRVIEILKPKALGLNTPYIES